MEWCRQDHGCRNLNYKPNASWSLASEILTHRTFTVLAQSAQYSLEVEKGGYGLPMNTRKVWKNLLKWYLITKSLQLSMLLFGGRKRRLRAAHEHPKSLKKNCWSGTLSPSRCSSACCSLEVEKGGYGLPMNTRKVWKKIVEVVPYHQVAAAQHAALWR